jgi:hypothetical protein
MLCEQRVPQLKWYIQGQSFLFDAKVLPLRCYDLILGEDWLEDHNPLLIDYKLKTMQFSVDEKVVQLQGVVDDTTQCTLVTATKLKGLLKHGAVSHCVQMLLPITSEKPSIDCELAQSEIEDKLPEPISALLSQYDHLFSEPTGSPPTRAADHKIPLVPGAQLVKVRPYRYSPVQKTEIEKQLKQMLAQGVIRHSTSSFASPVLLVRKKDGTWRFLHRLQAPQC